MNEIEKRARELLAAEHKKCDRNTEAELVLAGDVTALGRISLNAIIAALTPPEGYVLVPVILTQEMEDAGYPADTAQEGWAAMLAARPEVP